MINSGGKTTSGTICGICVVRNMAIRLFNVIKINRMRTGDFGGMLEIVWTSSSNRPKPPLSSPRAPCRRHSGTHPAPAVADDYGKTSGDDHVGLLDTGLSGRAVRGDRGDQRTGRVAGSRPRLLAIAGVTFCMATPNQPQVSGHAP